MPSAMVSAAASKIKKPNSAFRGSQLKERAHSLCSQHKSSDLVSSLLILPPTHCLFVCVYPMILLMFPPYCRYSPPPLYVEPEAQVPLFRERGEIPPQRRDFPAPFVYVGLLLSSSFGIRAHIISKAGRTPGSLVKSTSRGPKYVFHRLGNQVSSERMSSFIFRNIWFGCMHCCRHL